MRHLMCRNFIGEYSRLARGASVAQTSFAFAAKQAIRESNVGNIADFLCSRISDSVPINENSRVGKLRVKSPQHQSLPLLKHSSGINLFSRPEAA
jgi:hypothetical protein